MCGFFISALHEKFSRDQCFREQSKRCAIAQMEFLLGLRAILRGVSGAIGALHKNTAPPPK
jgi:hypothetical protein